MLKVYYYYFEFISNSKFKECSKILNGSLQMLLDSLLPWQYCFNKIFFESLKIKTNLFDQTIKFCYSSKRKLFVQGLKGFVIFFKNNDQMLSSSVLFKKQTICLHQDPFYSNEFNFNSKLQRNILSLISL